MKTPTISIIIPTQGRPTLERTLVSVRGQLLPGDEIVLVVDAFEMPTETLREIVGRAGGDEQIRVIAHNAERHSHGHDQINVGMEMATGDYLSFQDDDDVYADGALAHMREAATAHPGRPLLFRFRSHLGGTVFWLQPGLVQQACIGGHCLVTPNDPARLGEWGAHYEGDFSMIVETLEKWKPVEPVWCTPIIAIARPQEVA